MLRAWYAAQAREHGWSRNVLALRIDSRLRERAGRALTNSSRTLPPPRSDLAQRLMKTRSRSTSSCSARRSWSTLLAHRKGFLLALGAGFAHVGRPYHLVVGGDFQPAHAGKMNLYLAAVDDRLRHRDDPPNIGSILCRTRDCPLVECALSASAAHTCARRRRSPISIHGEGARGSAG